MRPGHGTQLNNSYGFFIVAFAILSAKSICLTMAIRTYNPQVAQQIVFIVTINMIELALDWFSVPLTDATHLALIGFQLVSYQPRSQFRRFILRMKPMHNNVIKRDNSLILNINKTKVISF